ncbi:hypothetical protein KC726_00850 [Candidatus Woesebacteria bacterium]|nr:hypothetical protein [Candidatus Woesebacteria bacterium]
MNLKGEIHFDMPLSKAEVDVVGNMWSIFNNNSLPKSVYIPCGGTMRHVPYLLQNGITNAVVADLSGMSLQMGRKRYGYLFKNNVSIYQADIRDTHVFMGHCQGGFPLAILMGNSLGDVTDEQGHMEFIGALSDALRPGGMLVFDYVSDGYNPLPGETLDTTWPEVLIKDNGTKQHVFDRRTRTYQPIDDDSGILHLTCEVRGHDQEVIVPHHPYTKRIVKLNLLTQQFAEVGMTLRHMGSIENHSAYHRRRNETTNDLGMMGKPNQLFVAIKN